MVNFNCRPDRTSDKENYEDKAGIFYTGSNDSAAYDDVLELDRLHSSPEKSLIRAIERSKNKEYNYSLFPT